MAGNRALYHLDLEIIERSTSSEMTTGVNELRLLLADVTSSKLDNGRRREFKCLTDLLCRLEKE